MMDSSEENDPEPLKTKEPEVISIPLFHMTHVRFSPFLI